MKKLLFVLLFASILPFYSCTAENDKKPLICEMLFINGSPDGFEISAIYTQSGGETMTQENSMKKSYEGKTAQDVIDKMIETEKDAMFKPVKKLVLKKDSKYNSEIAKAYINRSELQLKCEVFEADDYGIYDEKAKGIPFAEYYRKITEEEK